MTNEIKIIFIGTSEFALPSLEKIFNNKKIKILRIITQPDRKSGRALILTPPPIKLAALKYQLIVWQPEKIISCLEKIRELVPDLIVLISYGQIIPKEILSIPKYGIINLHASLLPKYRGAACLQGPILAGDRESGVTIIKIDGNIDTGSIIKQARLKMSQDETTASLHDKLAVLGASLLIPAIFDYINGKIKPAPQDNKSASYYKKLKKEDGQIYWGKSAQEIDRFVRAMYPWPEAFTYLENKFLKIIKVGKIIKVNNYLPGELFLYNKKLAVQCGRNAIIIERLQISGRQETAALDYLYGHKDIIGKILE